MVELFLDGSGRSLCRRDLLAHSGLASFPDLKDRLLEQAHVARRRLEQREFVYEEAFEGAFDTLTAQQPGQQC